MPNKFKGEFQRKRALSKHDKLRALFGWPEPSAHDRELRRARNERYTARKNGENVPKLPPGVRPKSSETKAA